MLHKFKMAKTLQENPNPKFFLRPSNSNPVNVKPSSSKAVKPSTSSSTSSSLSLYPPSIVSVHLSISGVHRLTYLYCLYVFFIN